MKRFRESIVFKSIIGIIVPLVILALAVAWLGYSSFTNGMLEIYEEGAIQIAQTAAADVDADKLDFYEKSGETTAEYQETLARMEKLCNTSGATFIYVIRPDLADYAHMVTA